MECNREGSGQDYSEEKFEAGQTLKHGDKCTMA
jgi:hypothetical protein